MSEDRPLGGYALSMGAYALTVLGLVLLGRQRRVQLPERVNLADVLVIGMATQKVSRIISKGTVTSPLRAPFIKYHGPAGASELDEEVVGEGVQHAVGELITCPFCTGVWVGTFFTAGLAFAPRLTRLAATAFAAVGVADLLQLEYGYVKGR